MGAWRSRPRIVGLNNNVGPFGRPVVLEVRRQRASANTQADSIAAQAFDTTYFPSIQARQA